MRKTLKSGKKLLDPSERTSERENFARRIFEDIERVRNGARIPKKLDIKEMTRQGRT